METAAPARVEHAGGGAAEVAAPGFRGIAAVSRVAAPAFRPAATTFAVAEAAFRVAEAAFRVARPTLPTLGGYLREKCGCKCLGNRRLGGVKIPFAIVGAVTRT